VSDARDSVGPGHWIALAASIVIGVTVVCAIVVMGTPAEQRKAKLDANRVRQLSSLAEAIENYAALHDRVPSSLPGLDGAGEWLSITDPDNGSPYAYEKTGDRSYRLCAVFATTTGKAPDGRVEGFEGRWAHRAGRYCFERQVAGASRR
jgi:hypothetical protein